MTVIIDTSFLVALTNQQDINHKRVVTVIKNLQDNIMLPTTVLPEVCYLLASRLGHHAMRRFITELTHSSMILQSLSMNDLNRVAEILNLYADSRLDFVDASIVALAEQWNISRLFTLDRRDFNIIRPRHIPYFDILP